MKCWRERSNFDAVALLVDMFVEKVHKILYSGETNTEMLAIGNDMTTEYVLINISSGRVLVLEFLHNRVVYDSTCLIGSINVGRLTGVNDNICQKLLKIEKKTWCKNIAPRSKMEIRGTRSEVETGVACCLPRVITAFWYDWEVMSKPGTRE